MSPARIAKLLRELAEEFDKEEEAANGAEPSERRPIPKPPVSKVRVTERDKAGARKALRKTGI